jgi:hypothetical protein
MTVAFLTKALNDFALLNTGILGLNVHAFYSSAQVMQGKGNKDPNEQWCLLGCYAVWLM